MGLDHICRGVGCAVCAVIVFSKVFGESYELLPIDEASRCSIETAVCVSAAAKDHYHPWLPDAPEAEPVDDPPPELVPVGRGWNSDMDAPAILSHRPNHAAALAAAGSMPVPLPLLVSAGNKYFPGMVVDGSSN
jgi:hypothetical protein